MKEEKIMILSMLKEGKITTEEALNLIEALENENVNKTNKGKNQKEDFKEEKTSKFEFNNLEDIGSDISNALSSMFSGLKDIGNSIGLKGYETLTSHIDKDISNIENPILDLKAINGNITVRPWTSPNIVIKVTCQYKNGLFNKDDKFYNFEIENNKVIFYPTHTNGVNIKLDVSIPNKKYEEIILNSTNGKIDIDDLELNTLKCITSNASIDVKDINSIEMELSTKNGRIDIKDSYSKKIDAITSNAGISIEEIDCSYINLLTANGKIYVKDIEATSINSSTSNSSIEVRDIKSESVDLSTSNGKITFEDFDLKEIKDIKLITSNGSINSDLHNVQKEVYFDLETSMGNITLELPDLVYKINKQANLGLKKIIAHSVTFDEHVDNLKFIASTSNGSIKIS